jgi:release factor glutamine methyltransferase
VAERGSTADSVWTIRRVVAWSSDDFRARGIPSPRLDAELLVAHALEIDRVRLYMDLDRPLLEAELSKVRELVTRRRKREPIAYILGRRELWSRRFEVGPGVLIPRPETEVLIERALALLPEDASGPVVDLCTGSGCIAITLAAERSRLEVDATDLSPEALAIAARNASEHAVEQRVRFHRGDLFAALPEPREHALIVCNPPYVAERDRATLEPDVRDHEPALALFGGGDGLEVIRRLGAEARRWLAPGAAILIEIGAGQSSEVSELLRASGLIEVCAHRDLAGHERVIEGARPATDR